MSSICATHFLRFSRRGISPWLQKQVSDQPSVQELIAKSSSKSKNNL